MLKSVNHCNKFLLLPKKTNIMKQLFLTFAIALTLNSTAQVRAFTPKTGDSELDKTLIDVNTEAEKDIDKFKDHVNTTLSLPKEKTEELLQTLPPGDVFMIAQTAQVTSKPVDDVKQAYEKNKDKGWGETAKELGIKPGSKEFHALKGKVKENKGKAKGKGKGKKDKKEKGADKKEEKAEKGKEKGAEKKEEKTEDKGEKGKGKSKTKH